MVSSLATEVRVLLQYKCFILPQVSASGLVNELSGVI